MRVEMMMGAEPMMSMNEDDAAADAGSAAADFLPMPQDPRIMLTFAADRRAKLETLWTLALRLTKLLEDVREPLIGQIKLAWWRDMMTMLAVNADAIPKGEPLLAEFQQHWRGQQGLEKLVDAAEALLMAEDLSGQDAAAADFGVQLFALSAQAVSGEPVVEATSTGSAAKAGTSWGLLWGAYVQRGGPDADALLKAAGEAAKPTPKAYGKSARGLLMLDRLAVQIATGNGARDLRKEGLILLRIGLFGR